MPRPKKCRSVCALPRTKAFWPEGESDPGEAVVLTVEEYEAIRLIDREGLSQEQCSEQMQVARTTVQQIYACARKKPADALVCDLPLRIAGGGDGSFPTESSNIIPFNQPPNFNSASCRAERVCTI